MIAGKKNQMKQEIFLTVSSFLKEMLI